MAALDQADLSFSDFMLVIANVVIAGLVAASIEVPGTELDLVKSWFTQELLTETHRKELLGSLETEASASVGIALLAKLTAKGTAVFKSHNEYRQEIRRRAERDPSELIRRVNLLLDAGTRAVSQGKSPGRTLTIVVDNLEKLGKREQVDAAVLRRADELRHLRAHLVLFFDPAAQYAPITVRPSDVFDTITMPMLPIREAHEGVNHVADKALGAVHDLLDLRVDLAQVFDPVDDCVREAARLSGAAPRRARPGAPGVRGGGSRPRDAGALRTGRRQARRRAGRDGQAWALAASRGDTPGQASRQ